MAAGLHRRAVAGRDHPAACPDLPGVLRGQFWRFWRLFGGDIGRAGAGSRAGRAGGILPGFLRGRAAGTSGRITGQGKGGMSQPERRSGGVQGKGGLFTLGAEKIQFSGNLGPGSRQDHRITGSPGRGSPGCGGAYMTEMTEMGISPQSFYMIFFYADFGGKRSFRSFRSSSQESNPFPCNFVLRSSSVSPSPFA
jgi:hypothetical protein